MLKCPSCQSQKLSFFLKPVAFENEVLTCEDCGTGMLKFRELEFDSKQYDYYKSRLGRKKEDLYNPITTNRYQKLLNEFEQRNPGRKILDVGCGQGHFIDVAKNSGWDILGIDLAEGAIAIAQSFGLNAKKLDFFSSELNDQRFDFITMFEFLEHVPCPADFVRRAEDLLNPGGILYITTPNLNSLDRKVWGNEWDNFHPEHLFYFSPQSLAALVEKNANLSVIAKRVDNLSPRTIKKLLLRNQLKTNVRKDNGGHDLRASVEASRTLRIAKAGINEILNAFGLGNAMKMTFQKTK